MSGQKQDNSSIKSFLSGGVGGMCLVLAGHPLDLIKVKVQTGNQSFVYYLKNTIKTQGLTGIYRGVVPPLLGVAPIMATTFWGYDLGLNIARKFMDKNQQDSATLSMIVFAGGFSAIPATVLVTPGERIKCILQVSEAQGKSKQSMLQVAKQIYKQGGIKSLYRGTLITLLRDVPGSMAYFATYEMLKKKLGVNKNDAHPSILPIMVSGGIAGMVNWMIAIPADVIKSRVQTLPNDQYVGLVDTYKKLILKEGYLGLYRGLTPALLRAFPANAACFYGVELSLHFMNKLF